MSRAGYTDDCDSWELIRWRGAVTSAIKGARGQAFLWEMLAALDELPDKRLIAEELEADGEVCALGSVGRMRKLDMSSLDPEDYDGLATLFGISPALVREIEFINDEGEWRHNTNEEVRFNNVRNWILEHLEPNDKRQSGRE